MWVEPLLNEEAPEPFSLSKSTLLSPNERGKESVPFWWFFGAVIARSSSPPLSGTPLEVVCANEASGGHNGAKCLWQLGRCTADGGRG